MVTLIRLASAPSTFALSECACSSAFQADASERASRRTWDAELAQAASPQAMVPLPAIPGRSYVSKAATGGGVYHASHWLTRQSIGVCFLRHDLVA